MTTRTKRTDPTTTRTKRISPTILLWVDYLFGDNQGVSAIVEDQDGNAISIFADSGYEQVGTGTVRKPRI